MEKFLYRGSYSELKNKSCKFSQFDYIYSIYLVHITLGGGLPTALQVRETLLSPSSSTSVATLVISTRGLSKKIRVKKKSKRRRKEIKNVRDREREKHR